MAVAAATTKVKLVPHGIQGSFFCWTRGEFF
jgi:hypothetical protein